MLLGTPSQQEVRGGGPSDTGGELSDRKSPELMGALAHVYRSYPPVHSMHRGGEVGAGEGRRGRGARWLEYKECIAIQGMEL